MNELESAKFPQRMNLNSDDRTVSSQPSGLEMCIVFYSSFTTSTLFIISAPKTRFADQHRLGSRTKKDSVQGRKTDQKTRFADQKSSAMRCSDAAFSARAVPRRADMIQYNAMQRIGQHTAAAIHAYGRPQ